MYWGGPIPPLPAGYENEAWQQYFADDFADQSQDWNQEERSQQVSQQVKPKRAFREVKDLWVAQVSDETGTSIYLIRARSEPAVYKELREQLEQTYGLPIYKKEYDLYLHAWTDDDGEDHEIEISTYVHQYTLWERVTCIYGV